MKNTQRKKLKILITLACVMLAALSSVSGVVLAKYINSFKSSDVRIGSADFFFTSAHPENTASAPYYVVSDTINLELLNTNGAGYTPVDTEFKVSLDGVLKTTGTVEGSTDKKTTQVALTSVSEGLHTVTIQSTSPYKKIITLYFYVYTTYNESFYKVIHHDNWVELKVYVGEDNGNITVGYTGVVPDVTNTELIEFSGGSGTLSNLRSGTTYTYIFFGEVSAASNPFVLEQNGKILIKGE